jgi:hypothetical protein
MKTLGDEFVEGMAKVSIHSWKFALLNAFQVYSGEVVDKQPTNRPWLIYLDLVALLWGYNGERGSYIAGMERRLADLLANTVDKTEVDAFTKSVGDFREQQNATMGIFQKPW